MNKLALALVLALGTTNVSAAVETKSVDTLENRIKSLNLSEEKKSTVMQLMKDNKIVTAAVGLALAAGLFVGVDCLYHKGYTGSLTQQGVDAVVTFLSTNIGTPVAKGWNTYGFGSVKDDKDVVTFGTLRAHPYYTTGAVLLVAAAVFAAYDLRKEEDASALKKLYKKYVSKQEAVA